MAQTQGLEIREVAGPMLQSAADPLPPTTLIVCSRDRPELLADLVASILRGREVPTEILVIDQSQVAHPTLATLQSDRECDVRYVWSDKVGLSRSRNLAIGLARHELLVFTDDDALVTEDWFGTLVRATVSAGPRAVVTGRVVPGKPEVPGAFVLTKINDEAPRVYSGRLEWDVLYTLNMGAWRSTLMEVGLFDVDLGPGTPFPAGEDNDLCLRLLEAGCQIHYEPGAAVLHRAWRAPENSLKLRWSYGRGQGAYYAKYFNGQDRYMLDRCRRDVVRQVRKCAHGLRYRRQVDWGTLAFLFGLLSGTGQWLLTRRAR